MEKWKKWIKKGRWIPGLLIVMFLVSFVEGDLLWLGIWGLIMFSVVMAGWRMWKGREQIKMLFQMAGDLGEMHKIRAKGDLNDKGIKGRDKGND